MAGKIKGITIELNGDTTQLDKALSTVDSTIGSLSKQLGAVERGLKLDPKNVTLLAEKSAIAKDQAAALTEKLKIMRDAADLVKAKFGENSTELRAFTQEMGYTEAQLGKTTKIIADVGQKLSDSSHHASVFADVLKAELLSSFITNGLRDLGNSLKNFISGGIASINKELENQAKLTQVMRNTMDAADDEVKSIINLTEAQERLGVISSSVQQAGAQELATYLTRAESLRKLMPVMNDMVAQQNGVNASQESAVSISTMLGKVMDGQVGALSRYGYKFSDAQAQILKFGDEAERVAVLAEVVSDSVGGMNEALGQTDAGKAVRAQQDIEELQKTVGQTAMEVQNSLVGALMPSIKELSDSIASFVERNKDGIKNLAESTGKFIAVIIDNAGTVISLLAGITAAFVAIKIYNTIMGIVGAYQAWKAATIAQTTAQATLNATTMAFPAGMVAAGIGVLVTGIGSLIAANEKAKQSQQELNEKIAESYRIKYEGIAQGEVEEKKQQLKHLDELKEKYIDIISLIKAMREDANNPSMSSTETFQIMKKAAEELGYSLADLTKVFKKEFGIILEYTNEGLTDFDTSSLIEINNLMGDYDLAIQTASISTSKYSGELDDAAKREIANNKEILQSWNDVILIKANAISEEIVTRNTATLVTEQEKFAIAKLREEHDKLWDTIRNNKDTIAELTELENGHGDQTKNTAEQTAILTEQINAEADAIKNLEKAEESLRNGGKLSIDQLLEYIDLYPEVAKYIRETDDATLDSGRILQEVTQARKQSLVEGMEDQAEATRVNIANLKLEAESAWLYYQEQVRAAEMARSLTLNDSEAKNRLLSTQKLIDEQEQSLNNLEAKIAALKSSSYNGGTSSKSTKSTSKDPETAVLEEKNNLLDIELEKLSNEKRLGALTAQQELDRLIEISNIKGLSEKETLDNKIRIFDAVNALADFELKNAAKLRQENKISADEELQLIDEVSTKYLDLCNTFELVAVKSDDISKQRSSVIKQQSDDYINSELKKLSNAKHLGELSAQEELDWQIKIADQVAERYADDSEKQLESKMRIFDAVNAVADSELKNITKLRQENQITADEELQAIDEVNSKYLGLCDTFDLVATKSDDIAKQRSSAVSQQFTDEQNRYKYDISIGQEKYENYIGWLRKMVDAEGLTADQIDAIRKELYDNDLDLQKKKEIAAEKEFNDTRDLYKYNISIGQEKYENYVKWLRAELAAEGTTAEQKKIIAKELYDYEQSLLTDRLNTISRTDTGATDIAASQNRLTQLGRLSAQYAGDPEAVKKINSQIASETAKYNELMEQQNTAHYDNLIKDVERYISRMEAMSGMLDEFGNEITFTTPDKIKLIQQMEAINQDAIDRLTTNEQKLTESQRRELEKRRSQQEQYQYDIESLVISYTKGYQAAEAARQASIETRDSELRKIDDEYQKSREAINQKLIADEKALTKAYNDEFEKRQKSIANYASIFTRVDKKWISGEELLDNLRGQLNTLEKWKSDISALEDKGLDKLLLDELESLGAGAADEIEALNQMTDEQLSEYAEIYRKKFALAGDIADKQLSGQRDELTENLKQLRVAAVDELSQLDIDVAEKIQTLNDTTAKQLAEFERLWSVSCAEVNAMASVSIDELRTIFNTEDISDNFSLFDINEVSDGFNELNRVTDIQYRKMESDSTDTVNNINNIYEKLTIDMGFHGENAMRGFTDGMKDMEPSVIATAQRIADAVRDTIARALDIHSPSRVMMKLGEYTVGGFAQGIDDTRQAAISAAARLSSGVVKAAAGGQNAATSGRQVNVENTVNQYFNNVSDRDTAFQAYRAAVRAQRSYAVPSSV